MFNDRKEFNEYLSCNENFSLSKGTIKTYIDHISKFLKDIEELNQDVVNNYYLMLKEERKPSYVNIFINALKYYVNFKGLDIKIPKTVKKSKDDTKDIVTYDYLVHDLFDAIDYNDWNDKYQIKAILVFMFFTGLRLFDYYNIMRKDFVFKKDYGYVNVFVKKNNYQKKVLFPKEVIQYIVAYFDTTQELDNAFNLGKTTITNIFSRLNTLVSDKHLHPHIMRRSCINYLYHEKKWSAEKIAVMIGISLKVLIENYLNISINDIEKEYSEMMN